MKDPGPAGQPGERQQNASEPRLTLGRKARWQRIQLVAVGVVSALTLLVSGGSWVLTSYVSGSLGRVNAGTAGTPATGPVNILVAGIDTRGGLTRQQEIELHVGHDVSMNSDTLAIVGAAGIGVVVALAGGLG